MRYDHHIFICANQKAEGKACCGEQHGLELVTRFREVLREKGLQGKVRAQRTGCIDACSKGPALVIYPGGTYYGNVALEDVERIVDRHIQQGEIIDDLQLTF
ncbi:MAG: (2Fe-2S) ferredoxin domain-containing protein [Bacteroidetes bacterium]|nr:MAG: (2Fe-2S) ferredoxin domain-containing protein [Bacteroidota bacterium]